MISARKIKQIVSAHAEWVAELGEAKYLDAAGIDSGYVTVEKMRDPRRANLEGRGLAGMNFPGIVLRAASLDRVDLKEAVLPGGDFSHASMERADLSAAILENAQLIRVMLSGATLIGTVLTGANLNGADLSGADLSNADLSWTNLRDANLLGADLSGANLNGADLSGADMTQAQLVEANMEHTNLSRVQLMGGNLRGANLKLANLSGAQLYGANLDYAFFFHTNLSNAQISKASLKGINLFSNNLKGAHIEGVDLAGVVYEPGGEYAGFIAANVDAIARADNLGLMTFIRDARPLEDLRKLLREGGYPRKALEITYALRRGQRQKASEEGSAGEKLASVLQFVFIEFPVEYGAAPFRPLLVISAIVVGFGFLYMVPLSVSTERFGRIWKISPKGRFFKSGGALREETLRANNLRGLLIAFWFSFLSAFNIGGRMFNLEDLFLHCQPEEYYLQATGWARAVSGAQSLISVYLLVLMLLMFLEKIAF